MPGKGRSLFFLLFLPFFLPLPSLSLSFLGRSPGGTAPILSRFCVSCSHWCLLPFIRRAFESRDAGAREATSSPLRFPSGRER